MQVAHTIRITSCYRSTSGETVFANGTINDVDFRAEVDLDTDDGDGVVKSLITDFRARPGFSRNMCNDILDAVAVRMGMAV